MTEDRQDLSILLRCRTPLIEIATVEEQRLADLIRDILKGGLAAFPFYGWSVVSGLERRDLSLDGPEPDTHEPKQVLEFIRRQKHPGLYVLFDFHPFLTEPLLARALKEIVLNSERMANVIILVSHASELPADLRRLAARLELSLPSSEDIRRIIGEEAQRYMAAHPQQKVTAEKAVVEKLVRLLAGLPRSDVRRLARNVIFDDGAITESELAEVNRAKFELLDMDGAVSFEYDTARFSDIGGLSVFRQWLQERAAHFSGQMPVGIDPPKGVLLVGVQGGGKSLAAKACAGQLGLPLLRLDIGALYNKYHGETERNLRDALKLAEAVAPCVLWFDEIEKGMASDDADGGTSRRILATLLTWLAEKRSSIFVVATANVIADLPPELIRKGRFDEIFFVDLPSVEVRAEIFAIHCRKRELAPEQFDLAALAAATDGFSGAEIEQVVVAARYRAHADQGAVSQKHLQAAISATQPLAVVMAEHLAALRLWAQGRTVRAD